MRKIRPTEFEQLLVDYWKDKAFIKSQKYKWVEPPPLMRDTHEIEPKEPLMRKLPSKTDIEEMESTPDKETESDEKSEMSPARKIMKAVSAHAMKPKKTKSKGEVQEPGTKPKKSVAKAKA